MSSAEQVPARAPRQSLVLSILILAVTLWAVAGYLLVPWTVHRVAPGIVAAALDAQLDIGDVHFDPFLMRLRLFDVALRTAEDGDGSAVREDVFTASRLEVDLSAETLRRLGPVFTAHVDRPTLHVVRAADGTVNLLDLLPDAGDAPASTATSGTTSDTTSDTTPDPGTRSASGTQDPTSPASGGALPTIIATLTIDDGRITVVDRSRPEPFSTEVTDLALSVERLTLPAGDAAPFRIGLALEEARLDVDGMLAATPEVTASVDLEDLPLGLVDRWLAGTTPLRELVGRVDLALAATLDGDGTVSLDRTSLTVTDFSTRTETPLAGRAAFDRLAVEGISGPLTPVDLDVASLRLEGPEVSVRWTGPPAMAETDTAALAAEADAAAAAAATTTGSAAGASAAGDAGAPRVRLGSIAVRDLVLRAEDATLPSPETFVVDEGRLDAGPVAWPPGDPIPLDLGLRLAESGRLTVEGSADLDRLAVTLAIALEDLDLAALAPWVDAWTQLGLDAGRLGFALDVDTDEALRLTGDVAVEDLDLADPDGVELVAWRRLAVDGIDVDLGARQATLEAITVDAPRGRFARLSDGSTNIDGIGPRPAVVSAYAGPDAGAPAPGGTTGDAAEDGADDASAETSGTASGEAAPWVWSVARIGLEGGTLDFVDQTLVLPFGTTIEDLAGEVTDVSSAPGRTSSIRLDGRVPPNGSARIDASLPPLAPLEDTRIVVAFRQVPMPRLTPYVGTFAGYQVASGRLDLDLDYRIEDSSLSAENRVVVQSLRLGPKVDSPDALDLPLQLGLALLRDADDRIVLDVPVSGSLDDPSFEIGGVILRAVGNVFRNIVSAPFRLLGSLLPSRSDPIDRVAFGLGEASIPEDQLERFVALEAALIQRPALRLRLPPTHAGNADGDALRIDALERRLAEADADPPKALRTLFAADYGEDELEALEAQYAEAEGGDATLAGELRGRLLADLRLADDALADLARERAVAVRDQLTDAGLPADRVEIADAVTEASAENERVTMSFELDAAELPPPSDD